VTPTYGLDIETDTGCGGLDPRISPILAVAVASESDVVVIRGAEDGLLRQLDDYLAGLAPGIIVTWNGAGFDLPFLDDRARRFGVSLGLRIEPAPDIRRHHPPLPGHSGSYRATWHDHSHLDAYLAYRALAGDAGDSLALKAVAGRAGLDVVEVDRTRIHELAAADLERYVASDATLALALARARWSEILAFKDTLQQVS
jgi:DNA polymerase elongation subunit (family B)